MSSRSASNPNQIIANSGRKVMWCENIHPSDDLYDEISSMISCDHMVIENIVKVNNPFLEQMYLAKQQERVRMYGSSVREELLFHGTKKSNVNSICTYNFDWRLVENSQFGRGVSFSPDAHYASHYSDESYSKVMIVAKVLISNVCDGHSDMVLPPLGYDTSQKPDGSVIVKYEDNEFLPMYKIYYHFDDSYQKYLDEEDDAFEEDDEDEYLEEEEDYYEEDEDESYSEHEDEDDYEGDEDESYSEEEEEEDYDDLSYSEEEEEKEDYDDLQFFWEDEEEESEEEEYDDYHEEEEEEDSEEEEDYFDEDEELFHNNAYNFRYNRSLEHNYDKYNSYSC